MSVPNEERAPINLERDYWFLVREKLELESDLAAVLGLESESEVEAFVATFARPEANDLRQTLNDGGSVRVLGPRREWQLSVGPPMFEGARPAKLTPLRNETELEAELDLCRKRFIATTELIPIGFQILSPSGLPTFSNDELHRVLGLTESKVDPDLAPSLIHSEDLDRVMASFETYRKSDRDVMTERYRIVGGDGVVRVVESGCYRVRDPEGETLEFVGYVLDLSEDADTFSRLPRNTEDENESLAIGRVGHWSWLSAPDRLTFSDTMYEIYGLEVGSPITADLVQSLIPAEQRFHVEQEVAKSIEENRSWEIEHDIVQPSGELRRIISRGRSMNANETVRIVGMAIDVTAQREREQQLRQAEKMRAIGQLASGVAHDFNNMLGAILGNATVLSEEVPPELQRPVVEIQIAAERVTQLTRKLLTFSRQQQLERAPNDIHELLDEVFALVAHSFTNGVEVKRQLKASYTRVSCDPSQIQSAFLNIVVNARDAMQKDGGLLVIETQNVESNETSWIEIVFRDDGPGMSEETRKRAFEPFFTTRRDEGGTGLGLSATYGAVLRHGGTIDLDSTVDSGTTFTIRLRTLEGDEDDDEEFERPSQDDRGAGRTIWLVDDEPLMRSLASRVFQRASYNVVAFESAEEVLEALEDGRPDVFLIDHHMPGMSGIALVEELRSRQVEVPIVMVTGNAFDIDDDWVRRIGVRSLVEKPYAVEELLGAVEE